MSKNYGLKSSVEGQDVLSFTLDAGSVTSQYANPKVQINQSPAHVDVETYTFASNPVNGTITLVTKAHGYTYTPSQWSMYNQSAVPTIWAFCPLYLFDGLGAEDLFYSYTDATNFYVKFKRAGGGMGNLNGTEWNFKYMLFVEDGA